MEHPFRIIKRVFGCDMVRYRGLDKNVQRQARLGNHRVREARKWRKPLRVTLQPRWSVPTCSFIPKCRWFPFLVRCISGSRALLPFPADDGAKTMVASTRPPSFSRTALQKNLAARLALMFKARKGQLPEALQDVIPPKKKGLIKMA